VRVGMDAGGHPGQYCIALSSSTTSRSGLLTLLPYRGPARFSALPVLILILILIHNPHPSPPTPCVQRRLSGLTAYFLAQLHTVEGCTALEASPGHLRCGHIVGLRFAPSITPGATAGAEMMSHLNARLKQHKVIASVRSGYLRVAPYVYNTSAEMAAVARLVAQLAAEVSSTTAAAGSVAGLPRPPPATTLLREVAAAAAANHSVRPFTVLVTGRYHFPAPTPCLCRALLSPPPSTPLLAAPVGWANSCAARSPRTRPSPPTGQTALSPAPHWGRPKCPSRCTGDTIPAPRNGCQRSGG